MEYSELLLAAKLILEIQSPSLEDCWSDGYDMSLSNSLSDNPFAKETASYHHWQEGWWAGFYENKSTNEVCFSRFASNDNSIAPEIIINDQDSSQLNHLTDKIAFE